MTATNICSDFGGFRCGLPFLCVFSDLPIKKVDQNNTGRARSLPDKQYWES